MIELLLFIFLNTATYSYGFDGLELVSGINYDSNVYYADSKEEADVLFTLESNYKKRSEINKKYKVTPSFNLSYNKFFSNSNLDFLDYKLALDNSIEFNERTFLNIKPYYILDSEPSYVEKDPPADLIDGSDKNRDERLESINTGFDLGFNYYFTSRRQIIFNSQYGKEEFEDSRYKFQGSSELKNSLYYKKFFLPETFFYVGTRFDTKSFEDQSMAMAGREKFDMRRVEPGGGVEGRLGKYFKIRTYIGYTKLSYSSGKGFSDPTYLLEIEEQLSPKDMVVVGYHSLVQDSFFSNFLLEQKLYLGYGRLFGDQLFLTSRVEYSYLNYIGISVREDQRLSLLGQAEYSKNKNIKYIFNIGFDQLESNTFNPVRQGLLDPVDPPASYKQYRAGLFYKYIF